MRISCWMLFLATLLGHPGYVAAEVPNVRPPENATTQSYGTWWACNVGYRKANNTCVLIQVPPHAYLNDDGYGRGWECVWGYRESDGRCDLLPVPQNAYLVYADRWECEGGYHKVRDNCIAIEGPEQGYLAESGWLCGPSYGPIREVCITMIEVPPNAFLADTTRDSGWKCNRGFKATTEKCIAVDVPENAHLSSSGNDWSCNRPYRRTTSGCEER